jgi:hypothetical protein
MHCERTTEKNSQVKDVRRQTAGSNRFLANFGSIFQLEYCFHFSGIFDVFLSDTVTFSHLSWRILRDSVTGTFDLDCHSPNQTVFVNEKECIRFYLSSLFEIKKSELEIRSLQAPSFQRIQASICVLAVFHHHEPTQRG